MTPGWPQRAPQIPSRLEPLRAGRLWTLHRHCPCRTTVMVISRIEVGPGGSFERYRQAVVRYRSLHCASCIVALLSCAWPPHCSSHCCLSSPRPHCISHRCYIVCAYSGFLHHIARIVARYRKAIVTCHDWCRHQSEVSSIDWGLSVQSSSQHSCCVRTTSSCTAYFSYPRSSCFRAYSRRDFYRDESPRHFLPRELLYLYGRSLAGDLLTPTLTCSPWLPSACRRLLWHEDCLCEGGSIIDTPLQHIFKCGGGGATVVLHWSGARSAHSQCCMTFARVQLQYHPRGQFAPRFRCAARVQNLPRAWLLARVQSPLGLASARVQSCDCVRCMHLTAHTRGDSGKWPHVCYDSPWHQWWSHGWVQVGLGSPWRLRYGFAPVRRHLFPGRRLNKCLAAAKPPPFFGPPACGALCSGLLVERLPLHRGSGFRATLSFRAFSRLPGAVFFISASCEGIFCFSLQPKCTLQFAPKIAGRTMGFGCCQTTNSGIKHLNFGISSFPICRDVASSIVMAHLVCDHRITGHDHVREAPLFSFFGGVPLHQPLLSLIATLAATKRHMVRSHPERSLWSLGPSGSRLCPRWVPLAPYLGPSGDAFFNFLKVVNSTENPRMVLLLPPSESFRCTGTVFSTIRASAFFSFKKGTLARAGSVFRILIFRRLFPSQVVLENSKSLSPGSRRFSVSREKSYSLLGSTNAWVGFGPLQSRLYLGESVFRISSGPNCQACFGK